MIRLPFLSSQGRLRESQLHTVSLPALEITIAGTALSATLKKSLKASAFPISKTPELISISREKKFSLTASTPFGVASLHRPGPGMATKKTHRFSQWCMNPTSSMNSVLPNHLTSNSLATPTAANAVSLWSTIHQPRSNSAGIISTAILRTTTHSFS